MTLRTAVVALGLLSACFVNGGCGSQSADSGGGAVIPTTEDQYKQMELENQSNEAAAKAAKTKPKPK